MIGAIVGSLPPDERPRSQDRSPETIRQEKQQTALSLIGGVCFLSVPVGTWFLTIWLAATFPWLVLAIGYLGIGFGSFCVLTVLWLLTFMWLERFTL